MRPGSRKGAMVKRRAKRFEQLARDGLREIPRDHVAVIIVSSDASQDRYIPHTKAKALFDAGELALSWGAYIFPYSPDELEEKKILLTEAQKEILRLPTRKVLLGY